MKKARGSAIVIAMLLITAVGAVAFSFGRVLYLEISNASIYESSTGAYYAAESGIEEGFLRYRYNRDTEIPITNWTVGENKVLRNNLTSSTVIGGSLTETKYKNGACTDWFTFFGVRLWCTKYAQIPYISTTYPGIVKTDLTGLDDASVQNYDLRIGSKVGAISGDVDTTAPNVNAILDQKYAVGNPSFHIARDNSKNIDMGKIFNAEIVSDIDLYIKPVAATTSVAGVLGQLNCPLIEAKLTGKTVDGTIEEKKTLLRSDSCVYPTSLIPDSSTTTTYGFYGTEPGTANRVFKVANLKTLLAPTSHYDSATLTLKPYGSDIDYLIVETNMDWTRPVNNPLNGGYSTISSTGYYGGVVRTLEANIDRQSGSLYDLFDYVIYKAN